MTVNQRGFSLLETLVSLVITVTVFSIAMSLLYQGQRMFRTERATQSAQALARKAINLLTTDLRATGCSPVTVTSGEMPGLLEASATRLRLIGDRKGNGTTNLRGEEDANDDVTYNFSGGTVTRQAPNDPDYQNSTVVLVNQVQQFTFRYFDRVGREIVPPTGESLDEAMRTNVVRIHIYLSIEIVESGEPTKIESLDSPVTLRYKLFDGH